MNPEEASDEARTMLIHLRKQVEEERVSTMDRVRRLRTFCQDHKKLQVRERMEWEAFYDRTAVLEKEIEFVAKRLTDLHNLSALPPVVIERVE